jgi:hypothetical protein
VNDITTALDDLAGAMTDAPDRLASVHRRARVLRQRRLARRGAVAGGAVALSAVTAGLLRSDGSSVTPVGVAAAPAQDAPTTTTTAADLTEPSGVGVSPTSPLCITVEDTDPPTPSGDVPPYVVHTITDAVVVAAGDGTVTVDRVSETTVLPASLTLAVSDDVEFYDGEQRIEAPGLTAGQAVQVILSQPAASGEWFLRVVTINPERAVVGFPDGTIVEGSSAWLPADC